MPDTLTVPERVRAIISVHLCAPPEKVTGDADLRDDLGADSLDPIELSIEIEGAFNISIADEQLEKWRTVDDIVATVEAERVVA